uniref:Prokineticin 2 n=2 Tax=Feliformia TaxID=379583 RepID=A0ABI7W475_FELCA
MRARAAPGGGGGWVRRGAARGGSPRAGTPAPVALWRAGRGALLQKRQTVRDIGCDLEEKACDKDPQCGGGMCCAVSIWVKSIRICTPMGKVGDSCHPLTRKNHFGNGRQERRKRKRRKRKKEVPFFGRRMHHTCPCMPGLACLRTSFNRFICLARK